MELDYERIAELVKKLQEGDTGVFNELYKLTSPKAYFVAFQITKNEQDAEDVLQESYMKMLDKIGTLDKPESFVSWFHNMVANKSKDSLKKKKPSLFEGGEDETFEDFVTDEKNTSFMPEESLNQEELRRAVMEAINELTEEKRACVLMMYFEDMSVNEISKTLEIPVSTVKNRVFTARKDLKSKFEKRGITSLYSTAPIGVIIWALSQTADTVAETFAGSSASASVLSGITVSSAASAGATAGTAATATAATTASASAGTAVTGTGIAAKVAALTVAQKVVAGVAIVGVVSGSAVGITTAVKNSNEDEILTTTAIIEEVTTAPVTQAVVAIVTTTEGTTGTTLTVEFSSDETETVTVRIEPTATTKKAVTTKHIQTTAKPVTTTKKNKTTTKRTTTTVKHTTTTKKATTTAKATTTKPTTTTERTTEEETTRPFTFPTTTAKPTTTAAPTTTEATTQAPAKLTVTVKDSSESVVATLNFDIEPGTQMSHDYLFYLMEAEGYIIEAGFDGNAYGATAEAGKSYTLNAYLGA